MSVEVMGELSAGTIIASNYRVVRRLGSGGFGTVYLGENVTLAQKVVIKTLQVGERGAGAEEARALASLDHPNVVHVYAYDERHDCIVMQHLAGKTVSDELTSLDLISAIRVAYQAALALSAVHERGLVHRDVKPENMMIELKAGEVRWLKLIDLGTALRVDRKIAQPAGTPEFCPPEQFDGSIGASPANDVYALGVTLFLLCSGRFPFNGSVAEIAEAHFSAEIPDLATVIREAQGEGAVLEPRLELCLDRVGELVGEMMAKEMRARPDARRVAHRLSEIENDFATEQTQTGFRVPSRPIPLSVVARTSTMVLSRPRPAPAPPKAIAPATSARWPLVAGGVLALGGAIATWNLWPRTPAPIEQPVVATPSPVIDAGPTAVVVAAAVAIDEAIDAGALVASPAVLLPPRVKKDRITTRPQPAGCEPDGDWKTTARANLQELTDRAARVPNADFLSIAADTDARLSKALNLAKTRGECASIEQQLNDFKLAIRKAGGK